MRIAYLTTDDVHQDLALQIADECGATLDPWSPADGPPDGPFDVVLYDLDYLPGPRRQEVLTELLAGPLSLPVAVHSYNLEEEQVAALRQHGVTVWQRLEPEVFRLLCRAIERSHAEKEKLIVTAFGASPGERR